MLQKLGQQQATEIPKQAAGTSWVVGSRRAAKDSNKRQNTPRQKSHNSYWRKAVNSHKARKARVKESVKYRPFSCLPSSSCQESRFRHKPAMHMAHSTSRQAQKLSQHIKSTKWYRAAKLVLQYYRAAHFGGTEALLVVPVSLRKKTELHHLCLYALSTFITSWVRVFTVHRFIDVFIAETLILKCQPTTSVDRTM